jgi:hypothetical protein
MKSFKTFYSEAKKPKPGHNAAVLAKNISKVMSAVKKEEAELDENIGGLFKDASEWERSAKDRGLVVKSMTHPSGEATKYQIAKDKQGNNRGHFDHETKSGRLHEATYVHTDFTDRTSPLPNKKAYAVDKANDEKKPVSLKKAPWELKKEEVEQFYESDLSSDDLNRIAKDHDIAAQKHRTAYKETKSITAGRNHEVAYNRHVDAAKAHREAAKDKNKHSSEKLEKMSNHAWDATDHVRNHFNEEVNEASYRDSGYRNMLKASRKADKEADKMRAQQAKAAAKPEAGLVRNIRADGKK